MPSMTEKQALTKLSARFGKDIRLETKHFYLEESFLHVDLCYCWQGDVIRAIGGTWEQLANCGT